MISFENFKITDLGPIYLQIIQFIKQGLASGSIAGADELPSRRVLSSLLGINPNTVQKAYHLLEEEGLVESKGGSKSCISATAEQIAKVRKDLLQTQMEQTVSNLKQLGIDKDEALSLLCKLWESEETVV